MHEYRPRIVFTAGNEKYPINFRGLEVEFSEQSNPCDSLNLLVTLPLTRVSFNVLNPNFRQRFSVRERKAGRLNFLQLEVIPHIQKQ